MRVDCPECSVEFRVPQEYIRHPGRWLRCGFCDNSWFEFADQDQGDPPEVKDASPTAIARVEQPLQADFSPVGHPSPSSRFAMDILDGSLAVIDKRKRPGWFGRIMKLRRQS